MRAQFLAALAVAALSVPFCAQAADPLVITPPQASGTAPPAKDDPNQRLLTPTQEGRQGVVKGVAEQPFRDFNLIRSKIPPVLQRAVADPYERPSPNTCQGIEASVRILTSAMGPDLDEPVSTDHPGLMTRGESAAKVGAIDAMRSGVQDYIPFDGVVRVVSGAEKHDRRVMAAIQAGAVRRAYLKGLGEARGCMPPGVPRHLARPATVAEEEPPKGKAGR